MEECLRRVCPCLETLWQRIFRDKKTSPGRGGEGGGSANYPAARASSTDGCDATPPSPAPESGSIYTALWTFAARHEDELSFAEGDLFSVTSRSGDWWTARRIDKNGCVLDTGIVPFNYLARAESIETQP